MVDLSHQIDILPSLFVLESIISNEFPIVNADAPRVWLGLVQPTMTTKVYVDHMHSQVSCDHPP